MNSVLVCLVVVVVFGAANAGPPMPPECLKVPEKNPADCCQLPQLLDPTLFTKCEADLGGKKPDPMDIHYGCCISECVLNATKLNVNGVIDKEAGKKLLKANLGENSEWAPIIDKAVEKCAALATTKEAEFKANANIPPTTPDQKVCNPLSGFLIGCVHVDLFMNCPKFTANEECNQLKQLVDKCPRVLLEKPK